MWVGVSAQRVGLHSATGLKAWSPARYGALDLTVGGTINDGNDLDKVRRDLDRFVRALVPGTYGFWNSGASPRVEVVDLRLQRRDVLFLALHLSL